MANILGFGLLISIKGMGWAMEQCFQVDLMMMKTSGVPLAQSHFRLLNQKKMSKKIRSINPMMMG